MNAKSAFLLVDNQNQTSRNLVSGAALIDWFIAAQSYRGLYQARYYSQPHQRWKNMHRVDHTEDSMERHGQRDPSDPYYNFSPLAIYYLVESKLVDVIMIQNGVCQRRLWWLPGCSVGYPDIALLVFHSQTENKHQHHQHHQSRQ